MRDCYILGGGGTRQGARSKKFSDMQASGGYSIEASFDKNLPMNSTSTVPKGVKMQSRSRKSGIVNIVSRDSFSSSQQTFVKSLAQR